MTKTPKLNQGDFNLRTANVIEKHFRISILSASVATLSSSTSSLECPPAVTTLTPTSPSLLQSLLGMAREPRTRTVSESHLTSAKGVEVDLGPWLQEGTNARDLRVARVRRNSSRAAEEALAAGLTRADIHMPPI